MKTKQHRPGIHEGYLMSRDIKIEGLTDKNKELIIHKIDELRGIDKVHYGNKNHLKIAYDGSKLSINQIEQIIVSHGCQFSHDLLSRWKLGWYRFTDQNVKDNATHIPHCCNKPPK